MIYNLNYYDVWLSVSARQGVEQSPEIGKVLNIEILEPVSSLELTWDRRFTDHFSMQTVYQKQGSKQSRSPSNRL